MLQTLGLFLENPLYACYFWSHSSGSNKKRKGKNFQKIADHFFSQFQWNFLEISAEESILRRKNLIPDRIESEGIKFLHEVNEGFKLIAKEKNWKIISGNQEIDAISHEIKKTLLKNFS